MKALFGSLDELTAEGSRTKVQPYLQAAQLVASAWSLIGIAINTYDLNVPKNSPLHLQLIICGMGSLFVAMGIYSLQLPFYYIAKRQEKERERTQAIL